MKYLVAISMFMFVVGFGIGIGIAIYQANTPNGLKCRAMGGHYLLLDNTCTTKQQIQMN